TSGGTYRNPTKQGSPSVDTFAGCVNRPIISQFLAYNSVYLDYDVNISSGRCSAGAVVTFTEAVAGTPGSTIRQTVSAPGWARRRRPSRCRNALGVPRPLPRPQDPSRSAGGLRSSDTPAQFLVQLRHADVLPSRRYAGPDAGVRPAPGALSH